MKIESDNRMNLGYLVDFLLITNRLDDRKVSANAVTDGQQLLRERKSRQVWAHEKRVIR